MKFVICGDFVSQDPKRIQVDQRLLNLLKSADYVAVNFEAPVRGVGRTIYKSGPALTQSLDSPAFIENLGANIIMLANNHMMDQDKEGCETSIRAFKEDTLIVGAGSFKDAYNLRVVEKDGIKVGLLCLVHKEFGALGLDSKSSDYGTAWINHPLVNKTILNAKKECDLLIVLPHAGVEDVVVPLPEWRARYKEFIDMGADTVIASHPHTPQGWEEYNGKKIFYSLGNFFFQLFSNQHGENWYKGLIVEMDIDEDMQLSFEVHNTRFSETSLELDESTECKLYNDYLCELLNEEDKYWEYLNTTLKSLWIEYKLYLLRGLGAVAPTTDMHILSHAVYGLLKGPDIPMMLNNFQCESHRWAIERMLRM